MSLAQSSRDLGGPDPATAVLFALATCLSALCLGAIHTPILCGTAVVVVAAAAAGWRPGRPYRLPIAGKSLFLLGACLTAFTALQATPLPASFVRLLSPTAANVWEGALAPLREAGPRWTTLSLDPIATRVQVLRGLLYLVSFAVALRLAAARGGTRLLESVILATALVLAVAAVLHPALGARKVFGIYAPVENVIDRHIAPLLNPNHLAAYLNIGYCLSLGLMFDRRSPRLRALAVIAALILIPVQIWVGSRGGLGAMAFGTACFVVAGRTSSRRAALRALVPGLVVIAGILMLVTGSSKEVTSEIYSGDASKIRTALSALRLALGYPVFGVGRGAFEVAFPALQQGSNLGYVDYKSPENLPVEWVVEWGIPVACLALLAIVVALRPGAGGLASSKAAGAWAAIAATAVHNLVDFNSEVPAIGIAAASCAAIVVIERGRTKTRGRSTAESPWLPGVVALAIGAATMVSVAVAFAGAPHELDADRADLHAMAILESPPGELASAIRAALERHPSEAYFPFIGGIAASRRGQSVVPWVERALTLAPVYAPAHYILAQELERRAPSQARLEYRLAATQGWDTGVDFTRDVLPRATRLVAGADDALELAPESGVHRALVLDQLAALVKQRLPATSERLDEILRQTAPGIPGPQWRAIQNALADAAAGSAAPWCQDRSRCVESALAATRELAPRWPGPCEVYVAQARLGVAAGNTGAALHALQEAAQGAPDAPYCWRELAELAVAAKEESFVTSAEQAVSRGGCASDAECADQLVWIAGLEERQGNHRHALTYYEHAREKAPDRVDIAEHTARLASGLEMHAGAAEAYRALARLQPGDPKWAELANREETLVMRGTLLK